MALQAFQFMSLLLLFSMMYSDAKLTINATRLNAADYDGIILPPGSQGTGAVEVFVDQYGGWLPVCETNSWDYRDRAESQVLCRQLGFDTTYDIPAKDVLLPVRFIVSVHFDCSGAESELTECVRWIFGYGTCRSIIVSCTPCPEGDVLLYNGTSPEEGLVAYCRGGFWRAVCDLNWSYENSFVVCRELGLPATAAVPHLSLYHPFSLGVYFDCIGNESSLADCVATESLLCNSQNIAGVQCIGEIIEVCSHGDVRLKNRRAEVCISGIWAASICTDDSSNYSTLGKSVCKQVFGVEQSFHAENCSQRYGATPYALYDTSCSEHMIHDCTFNTSTECDSVLNIECYSQSNCTEGSIRLVDGTSRLDGRFEVCVGGFWGVLPGPPPFDPIEAITPDFNPAEEICRRLEFPWEWALPFRISGDYPQLESCGSVNEHCYRPSCSQGSAYGVICQGNSSEPKECEHLDVRLVDGSKETEGRLEICASGYWSNVCVETVDEYHGVTDYWNRYAAILVCRKLGFPTEMALHNLHGAPFGSSPMRPVIRVDCGFNNFIIIGHGPQAPIPGTVDDCRIINQSYACSRERTIIGISCEVERGLYNIMIEVLPTQESYEIGTEITLRCVLPPSLQRLPSVTISWSTLVPDVLPFPDYDKSSRPNISFVIPANHPASANYNCSVKGTHLRGNDVLLAMEGTTIKIKVHTSASSRLSGLFIGGSLAGPIIAIVLIIMTIIIITT